MILYKEHMWILFSEHEWDIKSLASIANIESSIDGTIAFVERVEPWPKFASENSYSSHRIFQNRPGTLRNVFVCIV